MLIKIFAFIAIYNSTCIPFFLTFPVKENLSVCPGFSVFTSSIIYCMSGWRAKLAAEFVISSSFIPDRAHISIYLLSCYLFVLYTQLDCVQKIWCWIILQDSAKLFPLQFIYLPQQKESWTLEEFWCSFSLFFPLVWMMSNSTVNTLS